MKRYVVVVSLVWVVTAPAEDLSMLFEGNRCGGEFHAEQVAEVQTTTFASRTRYCTDSDGCNAWEPPVSERASVRFEADPAGNVSLILYGAFRRKPVWSAYYDRIICHLGLPPGSQGYDAEKPHRNTRKVGRVDKSMQFDALCGVESTDISFVGGVFDRCLYFRTAPVRIDGSVSRWYERQYVLAAKPFSDGDVRK